MTCPACEAAAKEAQTEQTLPQVAQTLDLQAPPAQEHGCETGRC